ncbi:MAG TPA: amidohydrolase family protein, partial [Thermoplasmataceae archaeon]|nr:amidohydrolase family protein [Thermoplasmataceae archaeon]
PIFVHPNDFMAKERLSKYYMGIVVGTLAETTVAVSSLLLGNVFGKFQKLKMVFCHGGGAIPYQIGRLQHAVDIREELKDANVDISKGIRNILFDSVVFTPEALDFLIKETGEDNVVLGTDYPFNMGNWNSAKDLQNLSTISETTRNKVMLENTKKLYGL